MDSNHNDHDREDLNLKPFIGMEFDTLDGAHDFYQQYARSIGFSIATLNSRRSRASKEFIDAKFACTRHGTTRKRITSNQNPESSRGERQCWKTECKASMHVKRKHGGKWVVHNFVEEHNHEVRGMHAAVPRAINTIEKSGCMALEAADVRCCLDFLARMQKMNSNFFYALDVGEDLRFKNMLWVDGKSRHDYVYFNDVVSLDTTYIRKNYQLPLAFFVGVNQYYHFTLLGCAILSDDSEETFSWLMEKWLHVMDGQAPKMIITDQNKALKSVISKAFPDSRHLYCLWHVLEKISDNLGNLIMQHGGFIREFEECIYRSWTEDDFEKKWWELVEKFELMEYECMQSLYEDRRQWVPMYMKDALLAGMSTAKRVESINAFFDMYVGEQTTMQEFVKLYEPMLHERYEEEEKSYLDSRDKEPVFKTLTHPYERSVGGVYTNAVLEKFQDEDSGMLACIPKKIEQDEFDGIYSVFDINKHQEYIVWWNATRTEISCMCRYFEYKGYLCRHALTILKDNGISFVPPQYVLRRWTKDAKHLILGEEEQGLSRLQRHNHLCQLGVRLYEEGSLSQESYKVAKRGLIDLYNLVRMKNQNKYVEGDSRKRTMSKTDEDKTLDTSERRKDFKHDVGTSEAREDLQQLNLLESRPLKIDDTQQTLPKMVQMNLTSPTNDIHYNNRQAHQGLGQWDAMAPNYGDYYSTTQDIGDLELIYRTAGIRLPYEN